MFVYVWKLLENPIFSTSIKSSLLPRPDCFVCFFLSKSGCFSQVWLSLLKYSFILPFMWEDHNLNIMWKCMRTVVLFVLTTEVITTLKPMV